MRRHTQAGKDCPEDAPPADSAARLAGDNPPLDFADAAGLFPVLPSTARRTDAIISASCAIAFAAVTVWISREGHAVPAIDRHIHAWVLAHRGSWDTSIARTVRWVG